MELANSTTRGPLPCPESRSLPIYPYTTGRRAVPCEGSAVAKTWHPSDIPLVPFIGQDG